MLEIVRATGAVAGLAAVVGLAVLAALYRLHARDVSRLREWAGAAPERSSRASAPQRRVAGRIRVSARHVAVVVCVLILGGVGALGVAQLLGDDPADGRPHGASVHKPSGSGAAVKPGNVTVAVLNGTAVPGLAAMLSGQLAAARFRQGPIDDYPDKPLTDSVVQYAPGREADARAVGRRLGISRLAPATADSRALAADATVIVLAGADQAP